MIFVTRRQGYGRNGSAAWSWLQGKSALVFGNDFLDQGQSHACAIDLGGEKGVCHLGNIIIDDPCAAVRDENGDTCRFLFDAYLEDAAIGHGLNTITEQVQE